MRIFCCYGALLALLAARANSQDLQTYDRFNCDYEACSCVFVELGGNGVGVSLNYEKLISRRFAVRGGFGFVPFAATTVPIQFTWFNGLERRFELGAGITYLPVGSSERNSIAKAQSFLLTATIGGRFQPRFGGFMIRYVFTPMYNLTTSSFMPFVGISLGHAF